MRSSTVQSGLAATKKRTEPWLETRYQCVRCIRREARFRGLVLAGGAAIRPWKALMVILETRGIGAVKRELHRGHISVTSTDVENLPLRWTARGPSGNLVVMPQLGRPANHSAVTPHPNGPSVLPDTYLRRPFAGSLPTSLRPLLPTTVSDPFDSQGHIFEVLWDGLRALVFVEREQVLVQDAYGADVTWRYPELQSIASEVNGTGIVLDGEIVVLDQDGVPHFAHLLERLEARDPADVVSAVNAHPVVFQGFDVLYRAGQPVMNEPLKTRKRILRQVVRMPGSLSVPDYVEQEGVAFFEAAREHGLAGTVAKHIDSSYSQGRRSSSWQVTRVSKRNEFVVGGFTYGGANRINRLRSREPFASLLLGAYDRWQQLRFIGEIAGGFDQLTQTALAGALDGLATSECPFTEEPPMHRLVFWCEPALVAAVAYSKWTDEGRLQFPKFEWLRPDVPPRCCHLPDL